MFVPTSQIHVEAKISNMMVLEDKAFWRWLGHESGELVNEKRQSDDLSPVY